MWALSSLNLDLGGLWERSIMADQISLISTPYFDTHHLYCLHNLCHSTHKSILQINSAGSTSWTFVTSVPAHGTFAGTVTRNEVWLARVTYFHRPYPGPQIHPFASASDSLRKSISISPLGPVRMLILSVKSSSGQRKMKNFSISKTSTKVTLKPHNCFIGVQFEIPDWQFAPIRIQGRTYTSYLPAYSHTTDDPGNGASSSLFWQRTRNRLLLTTSKEHSSLLKPSETMHLNLAGHSSQLCNYLAT